MKKTYLSDNEIDDITTAIYNDTLKDYYESVSQDDPEDDYEEVIKEVTKGEEYGVVKDNPDYIITKSGRIINCKSIKQIKPNVTLTSIYTLIRRSRICFEEFFEDNGWIYDYDEILRHYKKKKWGMTFIGKSRKYFKSL